MEKLCSLVTLMRRSLISFRWNIDVVKACFIDMINQIWRCKLEVSQTSLLIDTCISNIWQPLHRTYCFIHGNQRASKYLQTWFRDSDDYSLALSRKMLRSKFQFSNHILLGAFLCLSIPIFHCNHHLRRRMLALLLVN